MTDYIAYQGEQPLGIGTLDELSQKVGIPARILKRRTIHGQTSKIQINHD